MIGPFCKSWGVQQLSKKKRPLSELIEELNTKVTIAAKALQQQLADSAERPLLLSHSAEQPVPMDTSANVDLDQSEELKRKVLEAARKLHMQSAQSSSSASGSAEQPAKHAGTEVHAVRTASPTHTAEQLAQERAAHVQPLHCLGSLQECSDWLKTLPEHVENSPQLIST